VEEPVGYVLSEEGKLTIGDVLSDEGKLGEALFIHIKVAFWLPIKGDIEYTITYQFINYYV
jgi:hypothetical protein